jgi:hypothetical protein
LSRFAAMSLNANPEPAFGTKDWYSALKDASQEAPATGLIFDKLNIIGNKDNSFIFIA